MTSLQGDEERIGQILDELVEQARCGEPPALDQRCLEHPDIADRIRELFSALWFMEENKPVVKTVSAEAHELLRKENPRIGGYLIVREIARGGMGIVYEAIQLSLNRRVALKVISRHLLQDAKSIERFRREARLASQLHHSSIVPVFDVGEEGDVGFYAMQFIPGQSLDQVIQEMSRLGADEHPRDPFKTTQVAAKDVGPLHMEDTEIGFRLPPSPETSQLRSSNGSSTRTSQDPVLYRNAARIALQVAEALAYAHGRGILHRDIKPSNILIEAGGNAWVTDFGLARFDESSGRSGDESLTKTGDIVGTLKYLAPERLKGQHDHRCDIYGLAATLYELILCRPLFEAVDRVHLIDLVSNHEPVRPALLDRRLPRDLETIILKGLTKVPEGRYQSAQSMADDLRLFLLDRPIQARRVTWIQQAYMWSRRNRTAAGLASVLSISMAILLAIFLVNRALRIERDNALANFQRATKAEQESAVRAIVNDIAAYRMTLEPELTPQLDRLRSIPVTEFSEDLRYHVRNELVSCLQRDDWYTEISSFSRPAVDAAVDTQQQHAVSLTAEGDVELTQIGTGKVVAKSQGRVPATDIRFSREGHYVIVFSKINNDYVVLRTRDLSEVDTSHRMAAGCVVSDTSHRMAFWHAGLITVEEMRPEKEPRVILNHVPQSPVKSCDLSFDGRFLAYQEDTQIVVVDVDSGTVLSRCSIEGGMAMAFSPNGKWLATADAYGWLEVRDARTLEFEVRAEFLNTIVSQICWDQDSRYLACQTWSRLTTVINPWTQQYVIRTRQLLDDLHFDFRFGLLGSRYADGKLHVLKWRRGLCQELSAGPMRRSEALLQVVSHPKLPLIVARTSNRLFWFESSTGRLLLESRGFHSLACRFSDNGDRLVLLDYNFTQSWTIETDATTHAIIIRAEQPNKHQLTAEGLVTVVHTAYIKSDLKTAVVLTSLGNVAELDLATGVIARTFCAAPNYQIFPLGSGQLCYLHSWHQPSMLVLDTQSGNILGQLDTGPYSRAFAASELNTLATTNERQIEFWDLDSLKRTGRSIPNPVQLSQVAWHKDSGNLVTQTESSIIDIRAIESLEPLCRLQTDPTDVHIQLQFTSDGAWLLGTGQILASVRLWNLAGLRDTLDDWGLNWDPDQPDQSVTPSPAWQFDVSAAETDATAMNSLLIEEARALYARDKSDWVVNNLSWTLLIANRSPEEAAEAEALMAPLVARTPDGTYYPNTLGLALYRVGKFQEARDLLQANYRQTIGTSESAFDTMVLALVCKRLGEDSAAVTHLARTDEYRLGSKGLSVEWQDQLELLRAEYDALPFNGKP